MTDRFDVMVPRKRKSAGGEEKTYWVRIGVAFFGAHKQIILDALPLPDADGRCVMMLFEPKQQGQTAPASGGSIADMKDDIPF